MAARKTASKDSRAKAAAPIDSAALAAQFDKRATDGGFADYATLTTWLAKSGYAIAKAGKAGDRRSRFERRLDEIRLVTRQARDVVAAFQDGDAEMNEALLRLVQQRLFEILRTSRREDLKRFNLGALARAVAEMGRASVLQNRWLAEVREKLTVKVTGADARVIEVSREAGLSAEVEQRIRNALLDITV
jgi:hypothetical protein